MTLDYEDAKKVALEQGQFLLLYFTDGADCAPCDILDPGFCEPCEAMDADVWSSYEIQLIQQHFVSVKYEANQLSQAADHLEIAALPTTVILDAFGSEYLFIEGYLPQAELLLLLQGFPQDMREIYAAEQVARNSRDSYQASFRLADRYQRHSHQAGAYAAGRLLSRSDAAYRKSQRQLYGRTDAPLGLPQRIELLLIENQLLRGNHERALQSLIELQPYFVKSNQPLGNYLFTLSHRLAGETELARKHYEVLQVSDNSQRWLNRLALWQ